jgi:hypothetical protein
MALEKSLISKIAAVVVRPTSTAQRIEAEHLAVADIEREIRDLQNTRAQRLLDDDASTALETAGKIVEVERRLAVHQDRLAAFRSQGRREAIDQCERIKAEAIDVFDKKFRDRAAAAGRLDSAIAEFSASVKAYQEIRGAPFASWHHDTFPPISDFDGYWYRDADRRIASIFRLQSTRLLIELGALLGGPLAQHELDLGASMSADIRNSKLPKQPIIDEEAA